MKLKLFVSSFLFSLSMFISVHSNATDYFVSNFGNDSNSGTSASAPWKTLSKVQSVCNNGTIVPGDRILFKKGESFTGTLLVGSIWGYNARSGTAASPITFATYGTGAKPIFQYPAGGTTPAEKRILMRFIGVNYYVLDGFNFTDLVYPTNDKIAPANCGVPIYLGSVGEATCNNFLIQNIDISLCGMGIVLVGSNNKVTGCNMSNFKNLKSTPNTGGSTAYEDYGANALTIISGNDNEISNNFISGAWAESLDFGWNGGACEIYNSCNRNKMLYNTIYDCGGVAEFGADQSGASAADNLFAYNKIINCGGLSWSNISGVFAINVSNVQYYNNVIVENEASRFSGPNTGAGITTPSALALIYPENYLVSYNGTPVAQFVYNMKNNGIYLSTGIKLARSGDPKTLHTNNAYKLFNGSSVNSTLGPSEIIASGSVFMNTTSPDPINWDFTPASNSPLIRLGQNLGFTKDFAGNPVSSTPNAGIFETATIVTTPLTVTATSGNIACNGGTTTIVVAASGGTAPYTGTGTFTVAAGTYTYTVTDANKIQASTSVTVTQPSAISLVTTAGTITSFGGTTSISAAASGGTGAFMYQLNNGSYQSSGTFSNIAAGTYTITAKDANGCTKANSLTITQPSAPLTVTATSGNIACNGGTTTISVAASGGTAPYTGTGTFTVAVGTYTYTVTDANKIQASTSVTVTQPSMISLVITAGTITSFGGTTSISAAASGGTGAFMYQLNNGSYQSSGTFSNIAAGTYTITAKDANGCTKANSLTITQPSLAELVVTATVMDSILCNGGTTVVSVSATGGLPPYTGVGNFTVPAGNYTFTVNDFNGTSKSVTVNIGQPAAINVKVTVAGDITFAGGTTSATVTASGGTGMYLYSLNGGTNQSSPIFDGLTAGNYTVNVKDGNNCSKMSSFTVNQILVAPLQITTVIKSNVTCRNGNDGSVLVNASGGTAPYVYSIGNTAVFSSNNSFTNLIAGTYRIFVKDQRNVIVDSVITITESRRNCPKTLKKNTFRVNTYPNPSPKEFNLVIEGDMMSDISVEVLNFNGCRVYQYKGAFKGQLRFGNEFKPGIYFVRVIHDNKITTQKIIKF